MSSMRSWDPTSEHGIGTGLTLLEASAGTGKTYNITSILLRLIVSRGLKMGELVVVTFTRAATAELRDRVRARLAEAIDYLERRVEQETSDEILQYLREGAAKAKGDVWLQRLRAAQASFDECVIATIHGFCQRMLQRHAFESRSEFDLEVKQDPSEVIGEIVDDWLSKQLHGASPARYAFLATHRFDRASLLRLARKALLDPDVPVLPDAGPSVDCVEALAPTASELEVKVAVGLERAAFVRWTRGEFDRRMAERRQQSYQDLMRKLAQVLREDQSRTATLRKAIGQRFKAALIDEFQDTDAVQWDIFFELFGDDAHRLFLIGDPKQAIYGFRGANVHVYLSAKLTAMPRCYTMRRNYRSDARLLDALNHVMGQEGFFGESNIEYVKVDAPAREPADRIGYPFPWSDPRSAPLQLRFVDSALDPSAAQDDTSTALTKGQLDKLLPHRVSADIAELLAAGVRLYDPAARGADDAGFRPIHPGDIAVLTRTGDQAAAMQSALSVAGIASVLRGEDSVLATREAFELQLWLSALASPGLDGPARTAATTRLFGRQGTLLASVDVQDPEALREWEAWLSRLASWRELYAKHGFLRTLRAALQQDMLPSPDSPGVLEDVTVRTLRRSDGERRMTNLWHLAELLHEAETAGRLQLAGLLAWLKRQRVQRTIDPEFAELRLERDDEAVSLMTIHKSKGLEFPVVFLPYLGDSHAPSEGEGHYVPDAVHPTQRRLDLRSELESPETWETIRLETTREQLRLFYVALTRARFRCVLYTGHLKRLELSPLAAALHVPRGVAPADRLQAMRERVTQASRDELWRDLAELAARSGAGRADRCPTVALSHCGQVARPDQPRPARPEVSIAARPFLRLGLDHAWQRHSYTSMTRGKSVAYVVADQEREGFDPDPEEADVALAPGGREPSPWVPDIRPADDAPNVALAAFPAGAAAGTLFHAWLENADFAWAHPQLADGRGQQRMTDLLQQLLPLHGFDPETSSADLLRGLTDVLQTPLGAVLGSTRLCDIPKSARLNELRFDFPIAGGSGHDRTKGDLPIDTRGISNALQLRRAGLPCAADQRLLRSAYLDGLDSLGRLAGFMTGSIDLVFRHQIDQRDRWFVVDYKSNRLDPRRTGRYPVEHFALPSMQFEMEQHHYYVQYHLYVLALHRYLRLRLGGSYDYDRDMGGVYYLFFRGMVGAPTPQQDGYRFGCFYDKPPFEVINALDKLFDRRDGSSEGGDE